MGFMRTGKTAGPVAVVTSLLEILAVEGEASSTQLEASSTQFSVGKEFKRGMLSDL